MALLRWETRYGTPPSTVAPNFDPDVSSSAFQPALSHWCYTFLRNRNVVGRFFTVYQRMEMLIDVLIGCLLILERLIATRAWEDFVVSVKMRSENQLAYGGNASWGLKNTSLAPHYQTV